METQFTKNLIRLTSKITLMAFMLLGFSFNSVAAVAFTENLPIEFAPAGSGTCSISEGSIDGTQTICLGNVPTTFNSLTDATANTGGLSVEYIWIAWVSGSSANPVTGATGSSLTLTAANAPTVTMNYRRCARVMYCGDPTYYGESNIITVTVLNNCCAINAGQINGDQTICEGDVPTLFGSDTNATANNGYPVEYIWLQWPVGSSFSSNSQVVGADSATLQLTGANAPTVSMNS